MKFSLKDKSAVVTGGGSGIGQAICLVLAENGATVHILEMQAEKAENTLRAIESSGGNAKVYECNVVNADEVKKAVASISEKRISIFW